MRIPNKRELQQLRFMYSWDIDVRDFMYLYNTKYFFFSYLCFFCIWQSFTFQKKSFRKNIKTNHDN